MPDALATVAVPPRNPRVLEVNAAVPCATWNHPRHSPARDTAQIVMQHRVRSTWVTPPSSGTIVRDRSCRIPRRSGARCMSHMAILDSAKADDLAGERIADEHALAAPLHAVIVTNTARLEALYP